MVGTQPSSRRRFMKHAGAGSLGIVTALAGCTGGDGGSDGGGGSGDGGDGGGSGDGGDGGGSGDGGSTQPQELQQVNITLAPSGFQGIMMDHIVEDTDILASEMEERGYTANVQETWEGAPLFAAGGSDFSTIGSFEAARLGVQRKMDLAVFAQIAPMFMGWWTSKGSEWDPANTGSAQASFDKLVEQQATTAVGSWAGGDVPTYTMVIDTTFGYTFSETNNDFETVTADYFAIPKLMKQGDVAAGGTSPIHGVARHLDDNGDPTHVELFSGARAIESAGLGVPPLNNLTTTQQMIDEDPGAAEGYIQAWHKGMAWVLEDPMGRIMEDPETHFNQLGIDSEAEAQYLVDWGVNLSLDNEYPFNYADQELTDEIIEKDKTFLTNAEERGFIPSGWEDRVSYPKIPQE